MAELKDSGNREVLVEGGAVRDIQEGKGRCDLLPLVICGNLIAKVRVIGAEGFPLGEGDVPPIEEVLKWINLYIWGGDKSRLEEALLLFCQRVHLDGFKSSIPNPPLKCYLKEKLLTCLLEVSIHFEDGAIKYGERNWEKGLPVKSYLNSGIRHFLKHLRGDTDEPHDRAFVWNMLCALWTIETGDPKLSAEYLLTASKIFKDEEVKNDR